MNCVCFLFVLTIVFLLVDAHLHDDHNTVLTIKDTLGIIGWNSSSNHTNFCSWPGIGCKENDSLVESLDLSHRNIRGNVAVIADLSSLKWLDLSFNSIEQPIPPSFGNLSNLEFLDLSSNKFTGSIPLELRTLRNLRSLNLSHNLLIGKIVDELEGLKNLESLLISDNKLSGSIPPWVGNLTSLRVLMAYENSLEGEIPNNLGSVSQLQILNLHSNLLEGSIPESIFASAKMESMILTNNRLSGSLTQLIGKCRGLSSIRIGNNGLIGFLPKTIGNIRSLTYFEADSNSFSGEIVSEFAYCLNLILLNLASNGFSGLIPPSLGLLTNLQELILSENHLRGDIPKAILRCKNLNKLDLSHNKFSGTIPKEICTMSKLQYLLLGQNSMHGVIPHEIGNCTKLLELQMGYNNFVGIIPPEVSRIKNLQISLNLSSNYLHGTLPPELGKLDKLVTVDVSYNHLSGTIPPELKGMLSLIEVNFSYNLFRGPIPTFVPFQKSPNSSFAGNKGLCGEPLSTVCDALGNNYGVEDHHRVSYKIILAVIGSSLAIFAIVILVVLLFMTREKQGKVASMKAAEESTQVQSAAIVTGKVFVENLTQAIDFDAVIKATSKESNKIRSGTFSTVYRAAMPSGMVISAKRLKSMDRTIMNHQNKMVREVERLSRLCHENVMRPIGFLIYDESAILLHHDYCNGTLDQFLHDESSTSHEPHWPRMLSIAIGIAQGLGFLHQVAIIHLDISSGNVLLDADFKPLLGETEISKLLDPSKGTASISAIAGSFGYIPPEYAYTMQVTTAGNVYSYGVVLLEILTRRRPVDEEFGEGMDLVKWVHGAPARGETPEQILDARLSTVSFGWRKQMLATLKLALLCTDLTPAKRPKMKLVAETLEEIKVT